MKYIIYGKDNCIFCIEAKKILDQYSLDYEYKDINLYNKEIVKEFFKYIFNIDIKTVPQIYIKKEDNTLEYIGGKDNLINYLNK